LQPMAKKSAVVQKTKAKYRKGLLMCVIVTSRYWEY
jgi:hypothetical protein